MKISAVFLDRDGVLNHDDPTYTKRVKDVVIHRDVPNAIRRLSDAGIKIFVVSNQACVSKGIIKNETARAVFNEVIRQSQSGGGIITDFFYCPHQDSDGCSCRKPEPGLLLKVAKKHNVKLERSVFVGDGYRDFLTAERLNMPFYLVRQGWGYKTEKKLKAEKKSCRIVDNLQEAVNLILESSL